MKKIVVSPVFHRPKKPKAKATARATGKGKAKATARATGKAKAARPTVGPPAGRLGPRPSARPPGKASPAPSPGGKAPSVTGWMIVRPEGVLSGRVVLASEKACRDCFPITGLENALAKGYRFARVRVEEV